MALFFRKRAKDKQPSAVIALDGKLITYAVRREETGEIVIGKDGRICAATEELELRFSDGSVPFACALSSMEYGELMSRNGVLITGDDTVTGKRVTVVAYYKYYR
ncbi:MAG: hypothetical protein IJN61_07400 [Clostridia bacterium]|nr:hypothetical protein [Clostridia bacterium]